MSFLWDSIKKKASQAGDAAVRAGTKTKLRGEMLLIDREIKGRKQGFGVDLYDFIEPLSKRADFFIGSDKMTETVRGPFLAVQREIAALENKRVKLKEQLSQAEVTRRAAFPKKAENFGEKVVNAGKATGFAGNEAKIKTEISMCESNMKYHKQEFGVQLFDVFVRLEDDEQWLPTIREVRGMYDSARQDIEGMEKRKMAKAKEIAELSGGDENTALDQAPLHQQVQNPADASSYVHPTAPPAPAPLPATATATVAATVPATMAAPAAPPTMTGSFVDQQPVVAPSAPASAPVSYGDTFSSTQWQTQPQQAQAPFDPFSMQPQQPLQQSQQQHYDPFAASPPPSSTHNDPFASISTSQQQQQSFFG